MSACHRFLFRFVVSTWLLFVAIAPVFAQLSSPRMGSALSTERQPALRPAIQTADSILGANQPADSIRHALLPYSRYNTDEGLYAGLMWNRYHYDTRLSPYRNLTEFRLQGSTKGVLRSRVSHERLPSGGQGLRIRAEAIAERLLDDRFYGIGNQSDYNAALEQAGWYGFASWMGSVAVQIRRPVSERRRFGWMGSDVRVDHQLLTGMRFYRVMEKEPAESLLFSSFGQVHDRSWAPYIGYGLVADSRDSETDPSQGIYASGSVVVVPWFGSRSPASIWQGEVRGYYTFEALRGTILAGRLQTAVTMGDRPWWMQPWLGGEESLRGLPMRRYRGDAMVLHSIALRKWVARLPVFNSRVGVELFTDAGRVFTAEDPAASLFHNHHRTWGASVLGSVFVDDFIGRADIAFWQGRPALYLYLGLYF